MLTVTENMENLMPSEAVTQVTDVAVLVVIASYALFSFLLMRQIKLMNRSLATPMEFFYTFLGRLHFAISMLLLLAAIINL